MIDELDEALRQLFIREMPIKNGEVEIMFDLPNRDWSARLSRPTLNLYLYDVRENTKLRQPTPMWQIEAPTADDTGVQERRQPLRVDLYYMLTAWASAPEDEHRLLSRALLALARYQIFPEDLLPEALHGQPPIPIMVAQSNTLEKPTDLWSVLDNQMRPILPLIVTLAFEPHRPIVTPLIRTAEVRFKDELKRDLRAAYHVGGRVRGPAGPLANLRVTLVERGVDALVAPDGTYRLGNLAAGRYTLEVVADGHPPTRHPLVVPSPGYSVTLVAPKEKGGRRGAK